MANYSDLEILRPSGRINPQAVNPYTLNPKPLLTPTPSPPEKGNSEHSAGAERRPPGLLHPGGLTTGVYGGFYRFGLRIVGFSSCWIKRFGLWGLGTGVWIWIVFRFQGLGACA